MNHLTPAAVRKRGQSTTEYIIILMVVAISMISYVGVFGTFIVGIFRSTPEHTGDQRLNPWLEGYHFADHGEEPMRMGVANRFGWNARAGQDGRWYDLETGQFVDFSAVQPYVDDPHQFRFNWTTGTSGEQGSLRQKYY